MQKEIGANSLLLSSALYSLIPLATVLLTFRIWGMGIPSVTASVQLQSTRRDPFCGNSCGCGFSEAAAVCREEMGRVGIIGLKAHKTQSLRADIYDQHYVNSTAIIWGHSLQVEAFPGLISYPSSSS